jgi:hypothetical protein
MAWDSSQVVLQLLVNANSVPSSLILFILMMEALSSSKMSVLTRATRHNIPEDAILHSHRRENLKSYSANSVPSSLIFHLGDGGYMFLRNVRSQKNCTALNHKRRHSSYI